MTYMAIEIYPTVEAAAAGHDPSHNVIATADEMAEHMADYRGHYHIITGFYSEAEASAMTYTDRGFAHLDKDS